MFRTSVLISVFVSVLLSSLSPVSSGDIIVVPESPYMGMNPTMMPLNQLSGDHLVWTDMAGIKLFNGLDTILLSYDSMAASMISGSNIAWRSQPNGRIYFWDGQYIRLVPRLYSSPPASYNFAFSDSSIAWYDNDEMGMSQLFLWNGTATVQLSSDGGVDSIQIPQISGPNAVWKQYDFDAGCDRLFFWNGTDRTEIVSGMIDMMFVPKISNSNVAWLQWVESEYSSCPQVFFWNGTEITQVTHFNPETPFIIYGLKLSGSNVVWSTMDGLYLWNGGEIVELASSPDHTFNCFQFDVCGPYVAWHQWQDYDRIYFYNGTDTVQITEPGIQIMPPAIPGSGMFMMSNQNIAWIQQSNPFPQVYFWNGQITAPLGDQDMSGYTVALLGVSGKNVAWYADGAIFLSRQIPESCQEALAMGYSIASDLNRDCKVNLSDVAILSEDWLRSFDPADASHEIPWAD